MKKKLIIALTLCQALLFSAEITRAQVVDEPIKHLTCVTEEGYKEHIEPLIKASYTKLMAEGKLTFKHKDLNTEEDIAAKMGAGDLGWPLRMSAEYAAKPGVYDYYQIWNYADLNTAEFSRLDWMCNTGSNARNYDGHNGVDIVPEPFRWQMMDDESVEVVAAMDGIVLHSADGYFDRNCGGGAHTLGDPDDFNGGYYGNFVALFHDDFSITVYAHMKSGTIPSFVPGEEIVRGQFLGVVGSSGNSSDPHLHFEVRTCEFCPYIEPWYDAAGCNDDVAASWWDDQLPYYDPKVVRVMTHDLNPVIKTCTDYLAGSNETINERNHYTTGATVILGVSMRDFLDGDVLDIAILNQSNVVQSSWLITAGVDYTYGYTFNASTPMTGDPDGTYRVRAINNGITYNKYFTIGCTPTYTLSGALTGPKGWIAGDNIKTTNTISGLSTNEVLYEAENYVQLNPGFVATLNSRLHVRIDDCTAPGIKEGEEIIIEKQISEINIHPNPNFGNFDVH